MEGGAGREEVEGGSSPERRNIEWRMEERTPQVRRSGGQAP